jgi:hypothetical protein
MVIIKGLPDEINAAINLLWEYADDACLSGRTKKECINEGYDCKSKSGAHMLTFSISRRA